MNGEREPGAEPLLFFVVRRKLFFLPPLHFFSATERFASADCFFEKVRFCGKAGKEFILLNNQCAFCTLDFKFLRYFNHPLLCDGFIIVMGCGGFSRITYISKKTSCLYRKVHHNPSHKGTRHTIFDRVRLLSMSSIMPIPSQNAPNLFFSLAKPFSANRRLKAVCVNGLSPASLHHSWNL